MRKLEFREYRFQGYQNYEDVQTELCSVLEQYFGHQNPYFNIAINEAVCNAARYAIDGPANAKITIELRVMPNDISVSIHARTHPFDAERYQKKLRELLLDPSIRSLEWGDYTADTEKSRGFWYMLMACDYMYVDAKGQFVTLFRTRNFQPDDIVITRIESLVPRFLVSKDGVIG